MNLATTKYDVENVLERHIEKGVITGFRRECLIEDILNMLEDEAEAAFDEGREAGEEEGTQRAYDDGYENGYDDGHYEGRHEINDAMKKGFDILEEVITDLLEQEYPPVEDAVACTKAYDEAMALLDKALDKAVKVIESV